MKKRMMTTLLLVVAGAAILSLAGTTTGEKPAVAPGSGEMQSEVSNLKAQIQSLENRVKSLESTVAQLQQPHLTPVISPGTNPVLLAPPTAEPRPPKIWGEKEINGWTFYVVPCEQSKQEGGLIQR